MSNEMKKETINTQEKKSGTPLGKRIAALVCIILLVSLYLITLLVAIFDRNSSGNWFMLCLIGTVTIPLLTWIYIWMYGVLTQKHTIASFDVRDHSKGVEEEALEIVELSEKEVSENAEESERDSSIKS